MCNCVYVYMYNVYMCTCIYVYVYTCICVRVHFYMCTCTEQEITCGVSKFAIYYSAVCMVILKMKTNQVSS